jgi:hypothetical protein
VGIFSYGAAPDPRNQPKERKMDIDMQVFVLPASLDGSAAERLLDGFSSHQRRFLDGIDVMKYAVDPTGSILPDGAEVEGGALKEHAEQWVASFLDLATGLDGWFEQRCAHRVPLASGGELLVVAFDLDGQHDAWYEDVFTLAVMHYAPLARTMGVRLPGEFVLDAR